MAACRQVTEICNVEPHPQDRTNVLTLTSSTLETPMSTLHPVTSLTIYT